MLLIKDARGVILRSTETHRRNPFLAGKINTGKDDTLPFFFLLSVLTGVLSRD